MPLHGWHGQVLMLRVAPSLFLAFLLATIPAYAQGVREHTRLSSTNSTAVDDKQAIDLTLTLSQVSTRPIQTWVRTSGKIDKTGKTLNGYVSGADAALIKVGQRVRAFPPEAKSSMYQARVTRVTPQGNRVMVEVTLASSGRENSTNYVMEIIVDRGEFLAIPNEAIIEEGDKHVVYLQHHPGMYVPQEIHTGLQGEIYTQVMHGLSEGDQIVTFGSFFIDSEYKLKSSGDPAAANEHQHHN